MVKELGLSPRGDHKPYIQLSCFFMSVYHVCCQNPLGAPRSGTLEKFVQKGVWNRKVWVSFPSPYRALGCLWGSGCIPGCRLIVSMATQDGRPALLLTVQNAGFCPSAEGSHAALVTKVNKLLRRTLRRKNHLIVFYLPPTGAIPSPRWGKEIRTNWLSPPHSSHHLLLSLVALLPLPIST